MLEMPGAPPPATSSGTALQEGPESCQGKEQGSAEVKHVEVGIRKGATRLVSALFLRTNGRSNPAKFATQSHHSTTQTWPWEGRQNINCHLFFLFLITFFLLIIHGFVAATQSIFLAFRSGMLQVLYTFLKKVCKLCWATYSKFLQNIF